MYVALDRMLRTRRAPYISQLRDSTACLRKIYRITDKLPDAKGYAAPSSMQIPSRMTDTAHSAETRTEGKATVPIRRAE
jgi:hypothetical protein